MTINSAVAFAQYTGNGSTATYAFPFRILSTADLLVTTVTTAGVETELVLDVGYTVSWDEGDDSGTITLIAGNLTSGYGITIRRVRDVLQETDIRNQGPYLPEVIEDALDNMVMLIQQQQDEIDRCLKMPESDDRTLDMTLPGVDDRASKFFSFDSDGEPTAYAGVISDSVTVSAYGETLVAASSASAALDVLGVSAFAKTTLDDASASATLTTLGVSTYAKTILDDTDAATARATLGFSGSGGTVASANIENGAVTGLKKKLTLTTEKTANYTVVNTDDYVRGNTNSSAFTFTLPTAVGIGGTEITVHYSGTGYANALTVDGDGSETIAGSATTTLNTPNEKVILVSDNANWLIKNRHIPSEWVSFTPTSTFIDGDVTPLGKFRRVGDSMEVTAVYTFTSAPASNTLTVTVPQSLVVDTAKLAFSSANHPVVGVAMATDTGTAQFNGVVRIASSVAVNFIHSGAGATVWNATSPMTWAANDIFSCFFTVPISGWKS